MVDLTEEERAAVTATMKRVALLMDEIGCPHCGHAQWLRFERLRWDDLPPRNRAIQKESLFL